MTKNERNSLKRVGGDKSKKMAKTLNSFNRKLEKLKLFYDSKIPRLLN